MSNATFTFGRFNPPTEEGHGKLVSAVQSHAEKTGGEHYIFPSHSQDAKKNPMSHGDKVSAMKKLFPTANVVSHDKVRTAIDAMKHLESKGHKNVTMVVGSDRVDDFHNLLNRYREKEYPGIKKVSVVSAGNRDPDAEGAEGMSASKMRGLVSSGKKDEFVSHYSDPKIGKEIHDKVKVGMETKKKLKESLAIFLVGGPGSGKDYVLKNIFSRFDLMEVQIDQVLNGTASKLFEQGTNVVINGGDVEKIQLVKSMLEGYEFDHVFVSVTNKVSRERNAGLKQPLTETKRIDRFLNAQKVVDFIDDVFVFNNSINLNESNEIEKLFFANQIEKLLERVIDHGLELKSDSEPKTFVTVREEKFPPVRHHKSGLPSKYVKGLTPDEIKAKKAHIEKNKSLSDRDPEAYKDMPGDKRIREKGIPQSKHTIAYHQKFDEQVPNEVLANQEKEEKKRRIRDSRVLHHHNRHMHAAAAGTMEESADSSLKDKANKSGVSLATLRKVYNRGVAAWNSGHRPGTTPQQWGHARVNSYIMKGKTYHTADKDLHEATDKPLPVKLKHLPRSGNITAVKEIQKLNKQAAEDIGAVQEDIDALFEMQLDGTDEYRKHAIAMTPGQTQEIQNATANVGISKKKETTCGEDCGCGGSCNGNCCGEDCSCGNASPVRSFRQLRNQVSEASKKVKEDGVVDVTPTLKTKRQANPLRGSSRSFDSTTHGVPVTAANFNALVEEQDKKQTLNAFVQHCCDHLGLQQPPAINYHEDPEWSKNNGTFGHYTPSKNEINIAITGRHLMDVMRTLAHELTHATQNADEPLPEDAGVTGSPYENEANAMAGILMRHWAKKNPESFKAMMESAGLEESIQYHLENNISFTENVFRPGSDNFFAMISEAKRLYAEGKYKPADEYEQDLLESNIGEKAIYEGKEVILDFPFQEILNEEDETGGHGIGKPFRSHGGGAVYVKNSKGNVIKVNFSQSGMKKRYNEPKRVRSFIARHHCLTNKDRTSASYWACRWPRYFSDTGQQWW